LGNKRHEISEDQGVDIARIYGDFTHDDTRTIEINGTTDRVVVSKVFDNEDFGYRKITIERPLRLSFQATPERVAALQEAKPFQNLAKSKKKRGSKAAEVEEKAGREHQEAILTLLRSLDPKQVWTNRE